MFQFSITTGWSRIFVPFRLNENCFFIRIFLNAYFNVWQDSMQTAWSENNCLEVTITQLLLSQLKLVLYNSISLLVECLLFENLPWIAMPSIQNHYMLQNIRCILTVVQKQHLDKDKNEQLFCCCTIKCKTWQFPFEMSILLATCLYAALNSASTYSMF